MNLFFKMIIAVIVMAIIIVVMFNIIFIALDFRIWKKIRRVYFRIFKHYRRIELKCVTYLDAGKLLDENESKPERERWHLAKEEDDNDLIDFVYLERRERITE